MGIILHEILHALGMFHEQNRPDRDDHIEIFTAHIAPKMQHSFEILPNMSVHGTKYDIESIMHYGPLDFALSSAHPTMLPKRHAPRMGQRRTLTHLDVVKLQNAYRCDWPEPGDEYTVQRYSPTSSISTTTEASLKANMSSTTSELLVTDTLQSNKHISVHVNETVTVSRNSSRSTRVSTKFTTAKYDVNATTSTTKAVIPLHATTGEFIATTAKSSYDNPYLPYREYSTEAPPPANPAVAHCFLPSDPGTCEPSLPRWHYDSTDGVCKRFFFSGCGGNKNNFETQLHCLFHCGKAQDKCKLPKVVGPCRGLLNVYYFDKYKRACLPFEYGGCQGNANRFPSAEECQQSCAHVISPPTPPSVDENVHTIPPEYPAQTYPTAPRQNPYLAICSMPADAGACDERQARYYYDISQGKCLSFTYTGCGGNQNHFHTLEQCEGFCAQFGVGCPARTCDIQCPYGYENDPSSCPTCRCVEPCRDMQCPAYAACTVQTLPNGEFVGTCTSRLEKAGTCPSLEDIPPGSCDRACGTDNECHGQQKCCNNGCGTTCMTPVEREEQPPIGHYPEPTPPPYEPESPVEGGAVLTIDGSDTMVSTRVGDRAILKWFSTPIRACTSAPPTTGCTRRPSKTSSSGCTVEFGIPFVSLIDERPIHFTAVELIIAIPFCSSSLLWILCPFSTDMGVYHCARNNQQTLYTVNRMLQYQKYLIKIIHCLLVMMVYSDAVISIN